MNRSDKRMLIGLGATLAVVMVLGVMAAVILTAVGVVGAANEYVSKWNAAVEAGSSRTIVWPNGADRQRAAVDLYERALRAVNDPSPDQVPAMADVLCATDYRLPDGRPSWVRDFVGGMPDRGVRRLDSLTVDPQRPYATAVERWQNDPRGVLAPAARSRQVVTLAYDRAESGRVGPCLLGVDTARDFPYGPDRAGGVDRPLR